jgi:hypothetical protein
MHITVKNSLLCSIILPFSGATVWGYYNISLSSWESPENIVQLTPDLTSSGATWLSSFAWTFLYTSLNEGQFWRIGKVERVKFHFHILFFEFS